MLAPGFLTLISSGENGPFRAGSVGPNKPIVGAPKADARCSVRVSADTTNFARRKSAISGPNPTSIDVSGEPAAARLACYANSCSPGPNVNTPRQPWLSYSRRCNSPYRSAGQHFERQPPPGLRTKKFFKS